MLERVYAKASRRHHLSIVHVLPEDLQQHLMHAMVPQPHGVALAVEGKVAETQQTIGDDARMVDVQGQSEHYQLRHAHVSQKHLVVVVVPYEIV